MAGKERYIEQEINVVASLPDLRPKKEDENAIFATPRFSV